MKIKHIGFILLPLFFAGCGSEPKIESTTTTINLAPSSSKTVTTKTETKKEEIIEVPKPAVKKETVKTEIKPAEEEAVNNENNNDDEYLRSITALSQEEQVSKLEFEEDKKEILSDIEELKDIMAREDYNAWKTHLDPSSIKYYSNPVNIRKAQKKLPDKTIQLHGMQDYFKYVFIPSRKRSKVDEIRYISKNNVKAVQVKSDNSIVIYYYFVKINNRWLIHIPEL